MSELFSALLACLVIDRKDPARLCQHLTIAYATSPRLAGHRLDARREMISDWIINQFLIQKTVMTYMEPTALTGESREISWHDAAIKDEFGNLIFECLALFPYTAWLALSPDELQNSETHNAIFWRSKIRDQLGEFRSQIIQAYDDRMIIYANYVNLIGGAAKKIFDKYRDHIANSAEEGSLDAITEAVAKSLDRGDPVSWSKIDTAWSNQGGAKDDDSILSGVLTAATLRWMLIQRSERIIGRVRKFREAAVACQNENFSDEMIDYLLRLHLPRLPQKRGIDEEFLKDALFQNSDFMVDRNRVTLFSSNLEERKTRLEHQVVGTKTLLGVSARMKARRFSDMLERATPAQ